MSATGYASWIGRISKEDAVLTKLLKDAGAVVYVKTNVPQTLMSGEVRLFHLCSYMEDFVSDRRH
jgi:Asp-tRNA(Asn)/Glu-tRNA(Gln) amidotransferase A subunit family amidase